MNFRRGEGGVEGLQVRIGRDELHAVIVRQNHVIHRIATRPPYPDDFNLGFAERRLVVHKINPILFHARPLLLCQELAKPITHTIVNLAKEMVVGGFLETSVVMLFRGKL